MRTTITYMRAWSSEEGIWTLAVSTSAYAKVKLWEMLTEANENTDRDPPGLTRQGKRTPRGRKNLLFQDQERKKSLGRAASAEGWETWNLGINGPRAPGICTPVGIWLWTLELNWSDNLHLIRWIRKCIHIHSSLMPESTIYLVPIHHI